MALRKLSRTCLANCKDNESYGETVGVSFAVGGTGVDVAVAVGTTCVGIGLGITLVGARVAVGRIIVWAEAGEPSVNWITS